MSRPVEHTDNPVIDVVLSVGLLVFDLVVAAVATLVSTGHGGPGTSFALWGPLSSSVIMLLIAWLTRLDRRFFIGCGYALTRIRD
ncbi:MAG TPA: hypothetical protein VFC19_05355 [Candidatus Limnocylindrales bacterium]|nr:hypothetical protein [Candidatus Limnocylindrales bacterium]